MFLPLLKSKKASLIVNGLIVDYDLTAQTSSDQKATNLAPGADSSTYLQRGTTLGVEGTYDPGVTSNGWTFQGTQIGVATFSSALTYPITAVAITTPSNTSQSQNAVVASMPPAGYATAAWRLGPSGFTVYGAADSYPYAAYSTTKMVTFTSTTTHQQFYVGKTLERSTDYTPRNMTTLLHVGNNNGYNPFSGTVSRVLVYNRVLSDSDITKTYQYLQSWCTMKGITLT